MLLYLLFGFRSGCSTVDDIFTLQSLGRKLVFNRGKRLYCAFIDTWEDLDYNNAWLHMSQDVYYHSQQ